MRDKEFSEIREIARNLEEQGLVKTNKDNQDEVRLTDKGVAEVIRWKKKNEEMDLLLFLFEEIKDKLLKIVKDK